MADNSAIEWTDATWNPVTGCAVVSPGCTNCYAMRLAGTRLAHHPSRAGLTRDSKAGPVWTGETRLNEAWLTQPLRWRRPRRIFVCAHGDLFAESVPDEWIDRVFAVMALAPHHTFQVLTKRARRMREYLSGEDRQSRIAARGFFIDGGDFEPRWPLPHVWLGVSAEDQARADERIPDLLATPAAVRFLSAEPLLGPIDLTATSWGDDFIWGSTDALRGIDTCLEFPGEPRPSRSKIDWVIVGGESGEGARPMHPDWARAIRDQCAAAGVAYFHKQNGEWAPGEAVSTPQRGTETGAWWWNGAWSFRDIPPAGGEEMHIDDEPVVWRVGKKAAGRMLDGREHNDMPGGAP